MPQIRFRSSHALLLVCGGLYVAAAAQARGPQGQALSVAVGAVVAPVLDAVNAAASALADLRAGQRDLEQTLAELARQRDANAALARSNQLLVAEVSALRQGSRLLAAFPSYGDGAVLCRVVARDVLTSHSLRIDGGADAGIATDAAVLAETGVVGRIDRVLARSARVQLLSHPAAAAAASVVGIEREALLLGGDRPLLTGLPPYTEVAPGTPVFTTGSEGIYPPGLPLGVTGDARTTGLFTTVDLQLSVHPADVVVVMVLPASGAGR